MGSYLSNKPPFCMKNHDCGRKSIILLYHMQVNVNLWIINPYPIFKKKISGQHTKIQKKKKTSHFSHGFCFLLQRSTHSDVLPTDRSGRACRFLHSHGRLDQVGQANLKKTWVFWGWNWSHNWGNFGRDFWFETSGNFLGFFLGNILSNLFWGGNLGKDNS